MSLVTDSPKTNVAAVDVLCKRQAMTTVQHQMVPSRPLSLAFDQCHIKSIRSQFLAKDMDGQKQVSSGSLKDLYRM